MRTYDTSRWDIEFMADNPTVRAKRFGMPSEAKAVRYPMRLLRYWFGYQLLREECRNFSYKKRIKIHCLF